MSGQESERRCIATGENRPKAELIRFVVGPDSQVVPDIRGRLPGRGISVSATREAIDLAVTRKLFSRSAKASVQADPELTDRVEGLLVRRLIEVIGLTRKAGRTVAGFEKCLAEIKAGKAAVMLEAADGAADGRGKLIGAEKGISNSALLCDCLTADELGQAFGRERTVHGVISRLTGRQASGGDALVAELEIQAARLAGIRISSGE